MYVADNSSLQAEARYWFCTEHAGARYYLKFRREADYAAMGVHENMPTPPRRWGEIMTRKKDWLDVSRARNWETSSPHSQSLSPIEILKPIKFEILVAVSSFPTQSRLSDR